MWAGRPSAPEQPSPADGKLAGGARRPLILFADLIRTCGPGDEGPGSGADQGERVFLRELGSRLGERMPTLVYSSAREATDFVRQVPTHPLISRQLAGEIRRHRPAAILYVYPVTAAALVRARLMKLCGRGAPTIMIALASHPLERFGGALRRLLWPDLVLVTSDAERRALGALGGAVETLPPGVDVDRFRPPADLAEKQRIRREWGLPEDRAIVLHVGHLVGPRNLGVLVELAARAQVTPVVLVSHVRDPESDRIRATLEQAGVVVLEGYRPRLEELYRTADCYIFPSSAWGGGIDLPLSVLEALASDLPVVSTPFGALPERFAGADGLRFATTNHDLVQAVEELLRLRPHTRHLVVDYTWEAVADRLLSLLGQVPRPASGALPR